MKKQTNTLGPEKFPKRKLIPLKDHNLEEELSFSCMYSKNLPPKYHLLKLLDPRNSLKIACELSTLNIYLLFSSKVLCSGPLFITPNIGITQRPIPEGKKEIYSCVPTGMPELDCRRGHHCALSTGHIPDLFYSLRILKHNTLLHIILLSV